MADNKSDDLFEDVPYEESLFEDTPFNEDVPEITPGKALAKGAQQGVSLGLSDELAGAAGALGYLSGSSKTPSREELLDIYRQARDEERKTVELANKQQPVMSGVGNLAGGVLLPAGAIAKVPGLLNKIKQGTRAGAIIGAVGGAGLSEAELTQPSIENVGEFARDVGMSTATGATLGAALPVAGAAISGVGSGVSKLAKMAKETRPIDYPITTFKTGVDEGLNIATTEGRQELASQARKESKTLLNHLNRMKGGLSKQYTKVLSDLEAEGVNVESSNVLSNAINELDTMISNPKIDDETLKEAKTLSEMFKNYLQGRETVVGYKPTKIPVDENAKRLQSLLEQKAKLNVSKEQPEAAAIEAVKKRVAEKGVGRQSEVDDALAKLGTEDKMSAPGFSPEEIVTDPNTGKRVVQVIDEQTQQPILKAFDDINTSDVSVTTDPDTGISFYKFQDMGSGKVYLKPISEAEQLSTKIEPVIGRPGVDTKMTPAEAKEFVTKVRGKTKSDALKEYDTKQIANDVAAAIDNKLNEIAPLAKLDKNYKNVMESFDRLKLDPKNDSEEVMLDKLTSIFSDIEKATKSGDKAAAVMDDVFKRIEQVRPGMTAKYKPRLLDLSKKLQISNLSQQGSIAALGSKVLAGAGFAGQAVGKLNQSISKTSDNIVNATPEMIRDIISGIKTVNTKTAEELSNILQKIENKDKRGRQALIFGVMQNPSYRQLLGVTDEATNEPGSE
jgi:hypothetical protein